MKEKLLETNIAREKGYIYFCGTDSNGKIVIFRAKSGRSKKEPEKKLL